jgi:S1-C subfamily serine protease
MIDKWKRAVVHLECATDSEHFYDRIKRIDQLREKLDRGEISHDEFGQEITRRSRDLRYHGTALFLAHKERRYLLTARHVVFDEASALREFKEEVERTASWPEHMRGSLVQSAKDRASEKVFSIIFRVPSLDEMLKYGAEAHREFLMNLGAGASFTVPYTFSSPEIDLALISLDQRDSRFANQLLQLGHEPLGSNDIHDEPSGEGAEVFTVGFPSSTALIGQISQHPASAHWASSHFSLPVSAFGRVSMMHDQLPFFWVDMSIYPGNSGGPLIEGDKLVGVVSAQATLPIEAVPDVRTRIPFGKIMKTKYVRDLLNVQEQKDRH